MTALAPHRQRRSRRGSPLPHVPLVLLVLFALFPITLLFVNAFKSDVEIKGSPLGIPSRLHPENFSNAWNAAKYGQAFGNSALVTFVTVAGVCLLAGFAAYGLTRFPLPFGGVVSTYYLLALTVPAQLYLVPLFFLWVRLHLSDSLLGLILIYLAIYQPFAIFLLRSYFLGMPKEIEDAARVDGCSELQIFWRIVVPLSGPAFLTVAVVVGTWTWNEFLFANTMLHKQALLTVPLRYVVFSGATEVNFALQSAAGMMVVLPVVVLFLSMQRTFVQGMTNGGLK